MKIVFVSDIHGSTAGLARALSFYDSVGADLLCLGGDIINYGPRNGLPESLNPAAVADLLNARKRDIVAVRGNCDSEVDQMLLQFPALPDYAVVSDGPRRFFLTHGHKFLAGGAAPWLEADVVVSGHTHLWELRRDENGTVRLNTGSVTFPKQGRMPTFGYYDGSSLAVVGLDGRALAQMKL